MPVGNDKQRDDNNCLSFLTSQNAFLTKEAINECQVKNEKSKVFENYLNRYGLDTSPYEK